MSHRRFLDVVVSFVVIKQNLMERWNSDLLLHQDLGRSSCICVRDINITFGKHNSNTSSKKRKRDDNGKVGWKKSISFKLPYWEHLLIRHNLDVMYIEKNICDSIVGTLLNIEGKTKDSLKAHPDLKEMSIRPALHPYSQGQKKHICLPHASQWLKRRKIFSERYYLG